jgi:hypothetical protein
MNEKICMNCAYWLPASPFDTNPEALGECRFNPPTAFLVSYQIESGFPTTEGKDWCGQFHWKPENIDEETTQPN